MGNPINLQRLQPYLAPAYTIGGALMSGGILALTCRMCTSISPLAGGVYGVISQLIYKVLDSAWTKFVHPNNSMTGFQWPVCYFGSIILGSVASAYLGFFIAWDIAVILHVMAIGVSIITGVTAAAILIPIAVAGVAIKAHIDGTSMEQVLIDFAERAADVLEALGWPVRAIVEIVRNLIFNPEGIQIEWP